METGKIGRTVATRHTAYGNLYQQAFMPWY
jgi:hypothetical protein